MLRLLQIAFLGVYISNIFWRGMPPDPLGCLTPSALVSMTTHTTLASPLLKSYLRATMGQERLNNVILLNIYQSQFDDLEIHGIVKKFAACHERRRAFFGSFD
jgi:hypothetical protein